MRTVASARLEHKSSVLKTMPSQPLPQRTTAVIVCRGSHNQSDFQPAAFVCSLKGTGLPNISFGGREAKFCRHLIFQFCNTIEGRADITI